MSSRKNRRSERVDTVQRVLLEIQSPALKEIVITEEVSENGAKVLARRKIPQGAKGTLQVLSSGRQVPCRVVWQRPEMVGDGRMETGIEIFSNSNFWSISFQGPEGAPPPPPPEPAPKAVEAPPPNPQAVVEAVSSAAERGPEALAHLWSLLVQALEEKGVFTRDDFIATLQRMGKSSA